MSLRRGILKHNQQMRERSLPGPRKLDDGEVAFRIPVEDMKVLQTLYPALVSHDHAERLQAWKDLRDSPVGEKYLVQRTPSQVRRSPGGIIVR